ncbi:MAG: thioesterase family protein [Acidaminococcaceae bacterium]
MTLLQIGLCAQVQETVLYTKVAVALGSGSLPVYATPAMAALMEKAACSAISAALPLGTTSVGISLNITHDAATLPGHLITASAELTAVEGRRLYFKLSAHDGKTLIGQGTHQRFLVDTENFMQKLHTK